VSEERFEELRAKSGTASFAANRTGNHLGAVWSEVGQASVLEVAPDLLLGIKFWSVARQPEGMPLWVFGEIGADDLVAVGSALVPQEKEVPGVVSAELVQEVEDFGAAYVLLRVKGQVEGDATTPRRHDEGTDARDLLVGTSADDKGGGLSTTRPGSSDQRGHHEPCLVEADQACLEAGEFFLARVHSC
jgi:hypothetical protein